MRDYRIYQKSLGYGICRKKEDNNGVFLQFLDPKEERSLKKEDAKTYIREEDALGALVGVKMRDGKNAD